MSEATFEQIIHECWYKFILLGSLLLLQTNVNVYNVQVKRIYWCMYLYTNFPVPFIIWLCSEVNILIVTDTHNIRCSYYHAYMHLVLHV